MKSGVGPLMVVAALDFWMLTLVWRNGLLFVIVLCSFVIMLAKRCYVLSLLLVRRVMAGSSDLKRVRPVGEVWQLTVTGFRCCRNVRWRRLKQVLLQSV